MGTADQPQPHASEPRESDSQWFIRTEWDRCRRELESLRVQRKEIDFLLDQANKEIDFLLAAQREHERALRLAKMPRDCWEVHYDGKRWHAFNGARRYGAEAKKISKLGRLMLELDAEWADR